MDIIDGYIGEGQQPDGQPQIPAQQKANAQPCNPNIELTLADIEKAGELVQKVHSELPKFDYNPSPADYQGGDRIRKNKVVLDNGAEYIGEWDNNG